MIQGFDEAVVGMKVGETKTVKIPPEKGYGAYRQDLVFKVSPDQFPGGTKPKVGEQYQAGNGAQVMTVKVIAVDDKEVTLDANHQLAGKNLNFDITMVEIKPGK
jgi:FKBP-type peptidyl-prolyl cis-trans isomerase 2